LCYAREFLRVVGEEAVAGLTVAVLEELDKIGEGSGFFHGAQLSTELPGGLATQDPGPGSQLEAQKKCQDDDSNNQEADPVDAVEFSHETSLVLRLGDIVFGIEVPKRANIVTFFQIQKVFIDFPALEQPDFLGLVGPAGHNQV